MDDHHNLGLIQKYLLKKKSSTKFPESLFNITKPIIWIHINYEINTREWENFYSRNTKCLNQPYINLLVKNTINKCQDNFHVIIIDDSAFSDLLPNWNLEIATYLVVHLSVRPTALIQQPTARRAGQCPT